MLLCCTKRLLARRALLDSRVRNSDASLVSRVRVHKYIAFFNMLECVYSCSLVHDISVFSFNSTPDSAGLEDNHESISRHHEHWIIELSRIYVSLPVIMNRKYVSKRGVPSAIWRGETAKRHRYSRTGSNQGKCAQYKACGSRKRLSVSH